MALNFVSKLISNVRVFAVPCEQMLSMSEFHSMALNASATPSAGGSWSVLSVRTNVRNHFPKPRENKRIGNHGYEKRMSTRSGRLIIMRRILKGKHILSH